MCIRCGVRTSPAFGSLAGAGTASRQFLMTSSATRAFVAGELSPAMGATDVTETLDEAIAIAGVEQLEVKHRPRLLNDNARAYLSCELRECLGKWGLGDMRDAL